MVMRQRRRISARERMLAMDSGLYQIVQGKPRPWNSPMREEVWEPPLVMARMGLGAGRMSVRRDLLVKTDMVDWESNNSHDGSMACGMACWAMIAAHWARVVPLPAEAGGPGGAGDWTACAKVIPVGGREGGEATAGGASVGGAVVDGVVVAVF